MPKLKYLIIISFLLFTPIGVLGHNSLRTEKDVVVYLIALGIVMLTIFFVWIVSKWIDKNRNN